MSRSSNRNGWQMRTRHILLTVILLGVGIPMMRAQQYRTSLLQEMGIELQKRGARLDSTGVFTTKRGQIVYEVELGQDGAVTHLGRPMLNNEMKRMNPSPLYRFIERYVLRLSLLGADERRQMLLDDKVKLDLDKMKAVDSLCDMSISSGEKAFRVVWSHGEQEVAEMMFPKNFELISGMNKVERDHAFRHMLSEQAPDVVPMRGYSLSPEETLQGDTSAVYIHNNGYYIIRDMKSETYYVRSYDGTLLPMYNSKFPAETLSNLFNQIITGHYTLHITQKKYGYKEEQFDVDQNQFSAYCRQSGCTPYIGIESMDGQRIKACIVYVNTLLNYNHLLYIETDVDVLRKKSGVMDAMLYCFIPTHSLKSLFQPNELIDKK